MRPSKRGGEAGAASAISADGRRVIQHLNSDRVMRVFNADSGEEVRTLPDVESVEFSPDGRWIVSASRDGQALSLRGAWTREERHTLDLTRRGGIESAWLSVDGRRLTTFGQDDGTALVRDVESRRILSMQTLPDGSWGPSSPDGSVAILWPNRRPGRLADVATGRTLTDLGGPVSLTALAFSRDGRRFAGEFRLHSVSVYDRTRVVQTATGSVLADIPRSTNAAAFDRTGQRVAFARSEWIEGTDDSAREVEVYDLAAGKVLWTAGLPPGDMWSGIALAADGSRVLVWSWQDAFVLDVGTREPRWNTPSVAGGLEWSGLSADGERVAILDDALRVFDVSTGDLAFRLPPGEGRGETVRWSPRARRLLICERDPVARVRDGDTGEVLTTLSGHEMPLLSAEYAPEGDRIVTVSHDQTARVWDADTGRELLSVGGHANQRVNAFRFLPESGDVLVVASCRPGRRLGRAEVRDPDGWALVARFPEPVRPFFFFLSQSGSFLVSADGALVAREWGGPVWSARTGERISHTWSETDRNRFTPMLGRSSPDGRWRLEFGKGRGGGDDAARVRVLHAASGDRRSVLDGHRANVTSARFGPASRLVVTASADRTARVWDATTGAEIMSLDHPDEVRDAAISPDGTFLLTLSEGKLRRFPMDPFAVAVSLGPRPLTAAERRRFEIGSPSRGAGSF
jgi:WD40 repeat protein